MSFSGILLRLPTSKSISYFWSFGSLLGMILIFQLVSGLFLSFYYTNESTMAFSSVQSLMYNVNGGWFLRILHFNGASFFFMAMYFHFFKGLFYSSYRLKGVWLLGLLMLLLFMMEAFLGYVLVWAQMSYWAAVVITSLLSVIPYFGNDLVFLIWGGFFVSSSTLKFFFVLHFLIPWLSLFLIFFHLMFLHNYGSTSKIGCHFFLDKVKFYPYFWFKDLLNVVIFFCFFFFSMIWPFMLGDVEMFVEADFLNSPVHIVPEWYFLFAYAILRAIPNKVLGVFFLFFSIIIFFGFLLLNSYNSVLINLNRFLVFSFLFNVIFLSWLGGCLVEEPFIMLSFMSFLLYFFLLFLIFILHFFSFLLLILNSNFKY